MNKLLIALGIGVVIALIDTTPMLLRKADPYTIATAFVHWVGVTVLVAYTVMPLPAWAKGLVVALISSLPLLIVMLKGHPSSVLPILGMTVVLGAATGFATARWAP